MRFRKPRRSAVRIALLTPYDGGNLGDGAIQEALIANFRRCDPQIQLCGITLHPARTTALHGIPGYLLAVTSSRGYHPSSEKVTSTDGRRAPTSAGSTLSLYRRFRGMARGMPFLRQLKILADETLHVVRSYRLLREVDMLVVAGGGQLDDEWGGSWGHPYSLLKWTVLARAAGSSVVFLSVGVCRVDSGLTKRLLKLALSLACYRSYRDEVSRQLALAITPLADGAVVPDLAFSLPWTDSESVMQPETPGLRVGVSPIAFSRRGHWPTENPPQYEHYIAELASFVTSLLRRGISVTLFSSSAPDEQLFPDLCDRVNSGLDDEARRRLSTSNVTTVNDLRTLLQTFDFVVSSRLHGVLLSFLCGKPSIAISYDRKVTCLMADLDQAAYCLDIRSLRSHDLLAAFLALQANSRHITSRLAAIRRGYDGLLQHQYRQVTEFLPRFAAGAYSARTAALSVDHPPLGRGSHLR
jgi:polysaccharide pyruvyl transferase WcaK-like protein